MGEVGGFGDGKKKVGRKRGDAPPLRVRQYKLKRAKGLTKRQAALAVGYSKSMAENAKRKIEDPYSAYFADVMEKEIPNELIAKTTRAAMEATKLLTANMDGQITDILEVADWPTRIGATKLAAELRGLMPRQQINVNSGGGAITLISSIPRPPKRGDIDGQDKVGN